MARFKRLCPYFLLPVFLILLAACGDRPLESDASGLDPLDIPGPALDIVDGDNGGNQHFFWLKPLGPDKGYQGVADGTLRPTVEICERNVAGDGCSGAPLLASFTRDSDGKKSEAIKLDGHQEYFVHWRMKDYAPTAGTVYRVRIVLQGSEFGHADVIVLDKRDLKAFGKNPVGGVLPISENGNLKISFRLEEGALETQFCTGGGAGCTAAVEQPGDGIPTTVTVTTAGDHGQEVVAVVKAPDAVFEDASGVPVPNVVVTAELKLGPPSGDVLTDDNQELPYFVEINTFPKDVFIDPDGPGVSVVICQDAAALANKGVTVGLHPQLILYKVGSNGVTRRLTTTVGAHECGGAIPTPPPSNVMGLLKWGAARLGQLVGPEPVRARRLHGGLNTTITRDVSLTPAFSTFGAALGPNAAATTAVTPANGTATVPVTILIQVRNALGQSFAFGGDTLVVQVASGPNTGAPVAVVDHGNGTYTATYTPASPGVDQLQILLVRSDGIGLGPIGGSPYSLTILPNTLVTSTADSGPGSLRSALTHANATPGRDSITFAIPGAGPKVIALASALPDITDAVVVDGATQPGYAGVPVVEVSGSAVTAGPGSGDGFAVHAGNVTIRGLAITSHPRSGVFVLQGTTGMILEANYIGTNPAGSAVKGNANAGTRYRGSNGIIRNNLISGNQQNGILMDLGATGDSIYGNVIGLDPAGTGALPNQWDGITLFDGVSGAVIRGNTISGNGLWGIHIQQSGSLTPVSGTRIEANVVGLDVNGGMLRRGSADYIDGSTNFGPILRGNGSGGVRVDNAPGTIIGKPGSGNVISGNTNSGLVLAGAAVSPAPVVRGNFIGTNPGGTAARGNTGRGIEIATAGVAVGGPAPGDRNVISGNISDGIVGGGSATIRGNYVGTDVTGSTALGNGLYFGPDNPGCCHTGIFVNTASNLIVGNLVSGNWLGIRSGDAGSSGNVIQDNLVGTDASGTSAVPNVTEGIGLFGDKGATQVRGNTVRFNGGSGVSMVEGTESAVLGGTGPGPANTISDNTGAGVRVGYNVNAGDTHNTIRGNHIAANGSLGIDLADNGVDANDPLDTDGGPNGGLNRPNLISALTGVSAGATRVEVHLDAAPTTLYEVEFFANSTCDPSGAGEGAQPILLATAPSTTNGSGQLSYAVDLQLLPTGAVVTATATDPLGSTSEFSDCVTVQDVPSGVFYWAPSGGGNGHFYQYVTGSQTWTGAETAAANLTLFGTAGHLVTITSAPEQAFVESVRTMLGLNDWRPWIGLSDAAVEGSFEWVTQELFAYSNWGGGEPSETPPGEDYVEMFGSGVWNDQGNTALAPLGFLVEYPVP